jgi:hypothetical protein
VLPGEHVFGVVGLQEAAAAKVAEDPGAKGVLETLQELVGEGGGFVETDLGFRIGWVSIRIILAWTDRLEEPVHDAYMVV